MSGSVNTAEENSLGLESLFADVRKYARLFGAIFLAVFAIVFAITYFKTPVYNSTATLLISNGNRQAMPAQAQNNEEPIDGTAIDSEVQVLKSTAIADRVVVALHLDKDPEFGATAAKPSLLSNFKRMFAHKSTAVQAPQTASELAHQAIVDRLLDDLSVQRVGSTKVVQVSFSSTSPQKAALIANAWTQAYLQAKFDQKEGVIQQSNGWLSTRLDELRKQVEDSERAVQEYKIAHNLLSADGVTLTEQEISDLNRQLATVQVDQAASAARLSTARQQLATGSNGGDVGEALSSSVVSGLRTQAAQISARLAELQSHYGPLHPEVIKAKEQLADVNSQIDAEIRRIMSNLDAQSRIDNQRTGALVSSVQRAQGQLVSNSKAMVKLNELMLNAQSARQLYESYLDTFRQNATQAGLQTANASVMAEAKIARAPSSPRLSLSLLLAFTGATIASGAAVMGRRAVDSTILTSRDVQTKLDAPYLASIASVVSTLPKGATARGKPHEHLVEKPLSAFAEGFRNLRASLMYAEADRQPRVVAITSALPGEGKTTTSVCLATAMAMAGSSVVVVDCDLRKRSVRGLFGSDAQQGLVEYLDGQASIDEVLQKDERTGIAYLPLSSAEVPVRDIFGASQFDDLLTTLKTRFDFVVLDTPPVLPIVDTRVIARKADAVALLCKWHHTPERAVRAALEILEASRVRLSGIALTQVDIRQQAKYGYGDAGYYYKVYRNYYTEN